MTERDPAWSSWYHMLDRCTNHASDAFVAYGGRGIGVCAEWLDFDRFRSDMGARPDGTSIGRIDNERGYCRENCRWETPTEQASNTRRTVLIDGITQRAFALRSSAFAESTVCRRRLAGVPQEAPRGWGQKLCQRTELHIAVRASEPEVSGATLAKLHGISEATVSRMRRNPVPRDYLNALQVMARMQAQQPTPELEWDS